MAELRSEPIAIDSDNFLLLSLPVSVNLGSADSDSRSIDACEVVNFGKIARAGDRIGLNLLC